VFVHEEHSAGLPRHVMVTAVSPRLKVAIEDAVHRHGNYDPDGRCDYDQAIVALLRDAQARAIALRARAAR